MILMFLTGADVLDDIMDGLHMCKIWLNSNEFEEPPQRSMTFLDFWLELMMILLFLTGADVLDDIMDHLHMPGGSYS